MDKKNKNIEKKNSYKFIYLIIVIIWSILFYKDHQDKEIEEIFMLMEKSELVKEIDDRYKKSEKAYNLDGEESIFWDKFKKSTWNKDWESITTNSNPENIKTKDEKIYSFENEKSKELRKFLSDQKQYLEEQKKLSGDDKEFEDFLNSIDKEVEETSDVDKLYNDSIITDELWDWSKTSKEYLTFPWDIDLLFWLKFDYKLIEMWYLILEDEDNKWFLIFAPDNTFALEINSKKCHNASVNNCDNLYNQLINSDWDLYNSRTNIQSVKYPDENKYFASPMNWYWYDFIYDDIRDFTYILDYIEAE